MDYLGGTNLNFISSQRWEREAEGRSEGGSVRTWPTHLLVQLWKMEKRGSEEGGPPPGAWKDKEIAPPPWPQPPERKVADFDFSTVRQMVNCWTAQLEDDTFLLFKRFVTATTGKQYRDDWHFLNIQSSHPDPTVFFLLLI